MTTPTESRLSRVEGILSKNLLQVVNVKSFGAKGDGVTDDTAVLQSIFNSIPTNKRYDIYFPDGEYIITSKLTVNINATLRGVLGHSKITNKGTDDALLLGTSYRVDVKNLVIQGSPTTKSGVVVASSYSNLENVYCLNNGEHGIEVLPNTWTVNINRCRCESNGKSGIYAVATGGSGQVNAINVFQSLLHSNSEHGIYTTGTLVNIVGNNIELNTKSGIFISTNTYYVYGINIKDNYIEANPDGCINFDLYPSKGFHVYNAWIEGNFLTLYASRASAGAAIIKATTDTANKGIASMKIGPNMILTDTVVHADLGNSVGTSDNQRSFASIDTGIIGDTADISFFYKNLGGASVRSYLKTLISNGYFFGKGDITYPNAYQSNNFISTISTAVGRFPMLLKNGNQFKKAGIYVTTNSTNYTLTFIVYRIKGTTGVRDTITTYTTGSNSGNKYVEMPDISALTTPQSAKVGSVEEYYLHISFANSDGAATNFQVGSPVIFYYE